MKERIQEIKNEFNDKYNAVSSLDELEELRLLMLGKKGKITDLMVAFREIPNEEKREVGKMVNELKSLIETGIEEKKLELKNAEINNKIASEAKIDITLPVDLGIGSLHPRTIIQQELEDIFKSMGFVEKPKPLNDTSMIKVYIDKNDSKNYWRKISTFKI